MRRSQPRAIRAPITSCHQARSAGSSPLRSARRSHQRASAWRPPTATTLLGRHRVAAVGEGDQGAGAVAAAAQDRHHRDAVDLGSARRGRRPRSRRAAPRRPAGEPRRRQRRRGGLPIGPSCQRRVSSSTSSRSSPRTRMWSSSPSRTSVEPRGGIAWPSRTITLTSASRGSPSSRTRWPAAAAPGRQPVGDHVAAHARGSAPTRAAAAAAPARRWSARAGSPAARSWRPGPGSR